MTCFAHPGHATPQVRTDDLERLISSTSKEMLPENNAAFEIVYVIINLKEEAYPGICLGGLTNSVEDRGQREQASGDGSPIVRVSGHSRSLVQNFYYINYNFLNFWYFKTTYHSNEFICQC